MVRKLVLAFVGLGVASVVAISLLTIPLLHRLPKPGRVSMDGITFTGNHPCMVTDLPYYSK